MNIYIFLLSLLGFNPPFRLIQIEPFTMEGEYFLSFILGIDMLYSLIKSLPFTEFLINTEDEFELVESYRMMFKGPTCQDSSDTASVGHSIEVHEDPLGGTVLICLMGLVCDSIVLQIFEDSAYVPVENKNILIFCIIVFSIFIYVTPLLKIFI